MRNALIVTLLAVLPLGLLGSTAQAEQSITVQQAGISASVDQNQVEHPYQTQVVERLQLRHMGASDLAAVLIYQYRGTLWVHVEGRRNGVLISGEPELVEHAKAMTSRLDVPMESQE